MKKRKKQILGLFGLAGVIGMTIFASTLPSGSAYATDNSTGTTVTVTVENTPFISITSPLDNSSTVSNNLVAEYSYSNLNSLNLSLKNVDTSQTAASSVTTQLRTGTGSQTYDLDTIGGYGEYILTIKGIGDTAFDEDAVSFTYEPAKVLENTNDPVTSDPIIKVDTNDDVCYMMVQAYLKPNMTPVFDPELSLTIASLTDNKITLPFSDNSAATGDYTVKIISYSCAADPTQIYEPHTVDIHYDRPADPPTTPPTGTLQEQLNITQADYLISGLLIFTAIGIGSIIFIKKHNRR